MSFFWRYFWNDERGIFGIDDLIIGGVIAGAGSAGGAAIGASGAASAQDAANKANAEQAQLNRDFQERMSSTAHQREMRDLAAAGLNPMLGGRGGASSPSGGSATMNPVNPDAAVGRALEAASGTAMQTMQVKKDFEQKDAQIAAQKAGALASVAQANNAQASAKATAANMPAIEARAMSARSEAEARMAEADFNKKSATYDGVANRVLRAIGGAADAVSIRNMIQGTRRQDRQQTIREERHIRQQGIYGTELD